MNGKVIIVSAPSGAGKTSIVKHVLNFLPELRFSTSATTRAMREGEVNGRDYHFLSVEDFKKGIQRDEFLEWEEVYPGRCYGTLLSVVAQMQEEGKHVAFDVDVCGGVNIKNHYGDQALSVFIQAPSVEVLRERLIKRQTDSMEEIEKRIAKAAWETEFAQGKFDRTIINDDLDTAKREILEVVQAFLETE